MSPKHSDHLDRQYSDYYRIHYDAFLTSFHSTPLMLAKIQNKVIIIDFVGNIFNNERFLKDLGGDVVVKKVAGYTSLQKDADSCSTFSVNTLKNCFLDREFISQVVDLEVESITTPIKKVIGQGREFIKLLSEEKKTKIC